MRLIVPTVIAICVVTTGGLIVGELRKHIQNRPIPLIEISSYSEINGKLFACPIGSQMTSEIEGKSNGANTKWITFCKRDVTP